MMLNRDDEGEAAAPGSGEHARRWTAREATEDWRRLGWRTRREVIALARQGTAHPDPRIARIARRWAEVVVDDDTRHGRRVNVGAAVAFGILIDVLLSPLSGGPGGQGTGGAVGGSLSEIRERRAARLILAASKRRSPPA